MTENKHTINGAHIDWSCDGKFNFTAGFSPTKAESAIANYAALLAPVVLYFAMWHELNWSILQYVVASVLALDMVGGVLTNSLGSMKRFLHSSQTLELNWLGKLVGNKFLFPAIHLQVFAVPLCFDVSWGYAFFWYGLMMASITFIHWLPQYIHRPVALLVVMLSIMLSQIVFVGPAGLEWLAAIYIIKLVLSHGVREEPYRPALENTK